jgi:cytochrome oxidase Cu insertion factor (SCO1/SenC/PrrC family)
MLGLLAGTALTAGPLAAASEDPFAAMRVQRVVRDVQAPPFKLQTLAGKPVALEDLKGKVVLFYFWRTW